MVSFSSLIDQFTHLLLINIKLSIHKASFHSKHIKMAFSTKVPLALFLSSLFIHAALAEIVCEELPLNVCAFAIASTGKRCLLETGGTGKERQCRTSEVLVEKMAEYIETDRCVGACGVERSSVGISSDSLLEPRFMAQLCSKACYHNCPNIVDLYFNLAAGEGVFLPDLCEKARYNPHRAMLGFRSSGIAPGPQSAAFMSANLVSVATPAPAPAPESFFM